MRSVRIVCVAVVALFVSGCVATTTPILAGSTIGRYFNIETARGFVIGESTRSDIRSVLGEPTQVFYEQNGQEIWQYQYGDNITLVDGTGTFEVREAYFSFSGEVLQDSRVNSYLTPTMIY